MIKYYLLMITIICLVQGGSAHAESNYRYHGKVCGWDQVCMREQARAQAQWERHDWDKSYKNACRQAHVRTYAKDYVSAVNCVTALQQDKQQQDEKQAQAARDDAAAKRKDKKTGYSGRSGQVLSGGKIVSY